MKAISIQQPWASLIVNGIKPIENRTWKTNFRGRVYVHASQSTRFKYMVEALNWKQCLEYRYPEAGKHLSPALDIVSNWPRSAIIGEVKIVDCVQNHPSVWAEKGCWNWVLEDPVFYPEPIYNVKGKLSFWEFEKPV